MSLAGAYDLSNSFLSTFCKCTKSSNSGCHILSVNGAIFARHSAKNRAPSCEHARHLWRKFSGGPLAPRLSRRIFARNRANLGQVNAVRLS